MKVILLIVILFSLLCLPVMGDELKKIEDSIQTFSLKNGLRLMLIEDHSVPLFHSVIYVDVGGSNENMDHSGISHILEHLAFKGTKRIGTSDMKKEEEILQKLDQQFEKIRQVRNSRNIDKELLLKEEEQLEKLRVESQKYVVTNEFSEIVNRHGVTGLNAGTSYDSTVYWMSFPSNKLETWASLECDRFSNPVFREFFKEKKVIMEERRMTTENNPMRKMMEEWLSLAFKFHPYQQSLIGSFSSIENITRQDVKDYFKKYYHAGNMGIAIYGDVTLKQLKKIADQYFSKIPGGKPVSMLPVLENEQIGEKRMIIEKKAQPIWLAGYHVPDKFHPDVPALNLVCNILTSGRTSRLYKTLIMEKKLVSRISCFYGFPGDKYPTQLAIIANPLPGKTMEEIEKEIEREIENLQENGCTAEELETAIQLQKVSALKSFEQPGMFLTNVLSAYIQSGSVNTFFEEVRALSKVTSDDIKRVSNLYLTPKTRTVILMKNSEDSEKEKK